MSYFISSFNSLCLSFPITASYHQTLIDSISLSYLENLVYDQGLVGRMEKSRFCFVFVFFNNNGEKNTRAGFLLKINLPSTVMVL